jgi:hypothetical protein
MYRIACQREATGSLLTKQLKQTQNEGILRRH